MTMTEPSKRPGGTGAFLAEHANQIGLTAIIAMFWIGFSLAAPGFTSAYNAFTLLRSLSIDIVVGFATMVVLATGGMNLSIGAIGVCSVMLSGYLMQFHGVSVPVAMMTGIALGTALGAINGFAIILSGVSAFVITLATSSLFGGGMLILTKASVFNELPPELAAFSRLRWGFVPPLLVISLGIGVALLVLFRYTALGREVLATGANMRAAHLSGVDTDKVIVFIHSLSGTLAALAGMLLMTRLGAAIPSIGSDWLLPSFLAPVLGGTLLVGGYVSVVGTILGALLVATIRSGLLVLQIGNFWLQLFLGIILLTALLADRYRHFRASRRKLRVTQ